MGHQLLLELWEFLTQVVVQDPPDQAVLGGVKGAVDRGEGATDAEVRGRVTDVSLQVPLHHQCQLDLLFQGAATLW